MGLESDVEVVVGDGVELPGLLRQPAEGLRGGIVCLHPAAGPSRHYHLFEHLANVLLPRGVAVLRYDRRPPVGFDDVPFSAQASDALSALAILRDRLGSAPVGLWAFSQGCWAAPLVAAGSREIAFLALVGAPGVSPAQQMRYSVVEQLRRAGWGDAAINAATEARASMETFLRAYADAQAALRRVADEPWFELTWLPPGLPAGGGWTDMDFDPADAIRDVACPTLLVYGEEEECVPIESSVETWRSSAAAAAGRLEVVVLPHLGHEPVTAPDVVSEEYEKVLVGWLDRVLPAAAAMS